MHSEVTLLLLCVTIATVLAQQMPTIPKEPCIYADCGATNVTPESPSSSAQAPLVDPLESPQKFRILSKFGSRIYIGGLRGISRIDPECTSGDEDDPWMKTSDPIPSCVRDSTVGLGCTGLTGDTNPTLICDNYIRVAEEVGDKVFVCGTSSAFPRCYTFTNNCEFTSDGTNINGGNCNTEESYEAHKPYNLVARNWDQNTTLAYFGDSLFMGSSPDISVTNSFVGKLPVTGTLGNFTSGDPYDSNDAVDTYTLEARSVNEASFVGRPYKYSRDGSDFVLFFFRETAVEHINQGKMMYSRVARVCQNDAGPNRWSSYFKARLNCSQPGDYPEDFNEIQDVIPTTIDGETYFIAVFTQHPNAPPQSAVCTFSLDDIHNVFQTSQFKAPESSNSVWLPINRADEPDPRPGFDCANPSSNTAFLQNNPLLNDLVENYNYQRKRQINDSSDYPLFLAGARFSRISIDSRGGTSFEDVVIFIGTDSGEVWKVRHSANQDEDMNAVKIFHSSSQKDASPITGLEFVEGGGNSYVYAATHGRIYKIDLQYGKAQTRLQYNQIYPPYKPEIPEGGQFNASHVIRSHKQSLTICDNREVILLCEGDLDPSLKPANATWRFQADNTDDMVNLEQTGLGHLIQCDNTRNYVYNPLSFIVIRTHNRTSGMYQCVIEDDEGEIESEKSWVTVQNCITEKAMNDRKAEFDAIEKRAQEVHMAYSKEGQRSKRDTTLKECLVETETCDDMCHWSYP